MASDSRTLAFGSVLASVLARAQEFKTQAELAERIGITPSAISQYISGAALPRIDVLAKLAQALNVSADYLLFGEDRIVQVSPEQRYFLLRMEQMLSQQDAKARSEDWFKHVFSERLLALISSYSEKFWAESTVGMPFPGAMADNEIRAIELVSDFVRVATTTLRYNVVIDENGVYRPGVFADTVVQNMLRGVNYKFYIPNTEKIVQAAHRMKEIFANLAGRPLGDSLQIFIAERGMIFGFILYEVNEPLFKERHPSLYRLTSAYIINGMMGFVAGTSSSAAGDMLLDDIHMGRCRDYLNAIETSGKNLN